MKKTNFLKIALTLVMAFVFYGANAQLWVSSATQPTDSVTIGVNVPYYVEPDAYFNPLWTAPTGGTLVSTFVWAAPSPAGAGLAAVATDATVNDNYIEYSFPSIDVYTLSVTETAATCPGPAVTMPVAVIASPTIAYNPTVVGTIIGATTTFCDGDAQQDDILRVVFTGSVAGNRRYTLDYTYTVDTYDTGTSAWVPVTTVDHTGASAITAINTVTYDLNDHTSDFAVIGGNTTRYVYTLLGVTDRISRKSNYLTNTLGALATWTRYDLGPDVITVTVNPAPVTGPIYHISNTWAL